MNHEQDALFDNPGPIPGRAPTDLETRLYGVSVDLDRLARRLAQGVDPAIVDRYLSLLLAELKGLKARLRAGER